MFSRKRGLNRFIQSSLAGMLLFSSISGGIFSSKVNAANWSNVHHVPGSLQTFVEYGNGKWMSLGYYLDYHVSTDAVTWDNRNLGMTLEPSNVKFLNSTWYLTGSDGVYKTNDPVTAWTSLDSTLKNTHINDIAYSADTNRYVLAGQDKLYSFIGNSKPEVVYTDNSVPNFYRVTYGDGVYIATTYMDGEATKIYRSTDGLSWAQVYTTNRGQAIFDIAYGNHVFVAVGEAGQAYVSNDGISWTKATVLNYNGMGLASVTYAAGKFYTVSTNERVASSRNGVDWLEEWSQVSSSIDFADIGIGGGRAVAVGYDNLTYDGHIKSAPVPVVNSVTVSPANATVVQGGTEQLTATVNVSGGAAQTVTWSSSDSSGNVTVDGNGKVSVASNTTPGQYTVTATSTVDSTKSGSATITVTAAAVVNSVTVSPANATVVQGGTEQLTATVDVSGGAAQTVTWSSSDSSGNVTVDTNGKVSVASNTTPGQYTVTATSTVDSTKSGSATITVTAAAVVNSVTVSPTSATVVQGGTEQLTATVDVSGGAAQTVTWSSSDPSGNVTVDGNGLVSVASNTTPVTYTVTATSTVDSSKSGSATITVSGAPVINSVTVSPANATVVQGGTEQLTATVDVSGGAAQTVTWSSSDSSGNVTVDANGLVSVASNTVPGQYTVTATSTVDSTKSGSATITVTAASVVNSVTVSPANATVVQGGTEQLTATVDVSGGAAQTVTWTSSDSSGNVTVDTNGKVSVASNTTPGQYTVTATSTVDSTKSGSATITVVSDIDVYTVTISHLNGGHITATPSVASAGSVISLNIVPDFGKRLKVGSLKYTFNSTDFPITDGSFVMPSGDVTISAEFEDISESLPVLSIVAPSFTPVTVGYEQPPAKKLIIRNTGMVDTTINSLTSSEPGKFIVEGNGGIVAAGESIDSWTVRPVTGLPAGTHSSVITAVYGNGEIATANLVLTVNPPSSSGGGENPGNSGNNGSAGGSQGSGTPSPNPSQPDPGGVPVMINGKSENIGKLETKVVDHRKITTVTPDSDKLIEWLEREGKNAVVTIPVDVSSDSIVGLLTANVVKRMADQSAVLELVTPMASYRIHADQFPIVAIADQLGADASLSEVTIEIMMSKALSSETSLAQSVLNRKGVSLLVEPVHFTLMAEFNGAKIELNRFTRYVERVIPIPETVDPNQITTGIVVGLDGSTHHVPTYVQKKDNRYYAVVNSLTNSMYTLVWHPVEFADVTDHWAQHAINDMGSRMIVTGMGQNLFEPNRDITRAEFVAMVVRALGLMPANGEISFVDVNKSDWFADYIQTAHDYQLIEGYSGSRFAPMDTITREQAMTIIAKAMNITGINPDLSPERVNRLLDGYKDAASISSYARDHIAAGLDLNIINGRTTNTIQPKSKITRAEVATLLQKLLRKSDLIQ
ncbi:uncharacterized protein YjdB [Paenibacillus sp. LBL]|uniref:Ig-like domain-containing protein n=1 Tax=Paenibacillus sp. LBL TaxID=2940563 RepID=UPI0024754248|nr:Ig-like domain-containing protein [Paenibacillus sp. LBL]MDH6672290.1 uncharacterized protein YjdB [Paenibacillus sp. LBL]